MSRPWRSGVAALAGAWFGCALPVHALDKQGSAHGGDVNANQDGFQVAGSASLGCALYNPTYAARPDNSGIALARYALHVDIDLIGAKLSIPIDLNTFTDRERSGARKLLPTELDVIGGVTTTWALRPGLAIEGGARLESDHAIDRAGGSQTYVDVRSRALFSLAAFAPELAGWLGGGDVSGWLTLGVFAYNPSYYARPDNTGLALMRYAPHLEVSFWRERLSVGIDATMFTDRTGQVFRPSELDLTPDVALHLGDVEVHLAYERDMPLDRGGLVQHWVYTTLVYGFQLTGAEAPR